MPNFNPDGSLIEVEQTPDELFSKMNSIDLNWIFKNLSKDPEYPDYIVSLMEVESVLSLATVYVVIEMCTGQVVAKSSRMVSLTHDLKDALGIRYYDRMVNVYQGLEGSLGISNEAERVKREADKLDVCEKDIIDSSNI